MKIAVSSAIEARSPMAACGASRECPAPNGDNLRTAGSHSGVTGWRVRGTTQRPSGFHSTNLDRTQMLVVSLRTHVWSLDSTGQNLSGESTLNHFGRQQ